MNKLLIAGLGTAVAVLGSAATAVTAGAATAQPAAATAATAVASRPATLARLATVAGPARVISADLGAQGDKISCASPTACLAVGG